jgi:tetratricopeptide (TPR) repeat protein
VWTDAPISLVEKDQEGIGVAEEHAIDRLLSSDFDAWLFDDDPKTLTFSRAVVAVAREIRDEQPQKAADMVAAAIDVITHITKNNDLRPVLTNGAAGEAWRERAECLAQLGRMSEALDAVAASESHFDAYASSSFATARLALTKANVLIQMRRGSEALFDVRRAAQIFAEYEDAQQMTNAKTIEAAILYQCGRPREALILWSELAEQSAEDGNQEVAAALVANTGMSLTEIGEYARASLALASARDMYEQLSKPVNVAIVDAAIGANLVASGKLLEGVSQLSRAADKLLELGLVIRAALARVEIVEVLLASNDHRHALVMARRLVDDFSAAGMAAMAMAALAYLREAVANDVAKPAHARHVRTYLQQSQARRDLAFVPLPEEWPRP